VHAIPMRAAGTVLGALGLFGTTVEELNDADLLRKRWRTQPASPFCNNIPPPRPACSHTSTPR
jgi:hypothetical protein